MCDVSCHVAVMPYLGFGVPRGCRYSNRIVDVGEGLKHNTELRVVCLQQNQLRDCAGFGALTKLHTLRLDGNEIERVEGLEHNTSLTKLGPGPSSFPDIAGPGSWRRSEPPPCPKCGARYATTAAARLAYPVSHGLPIAAHVLKGDKIDERARDTICAPNRYS